MLLDCTFTSNGFFQDSLHFLCRIVPYLLSREKRRCPDEVSTERLKAMVLQYARAKWDKPLAKAGHFARVQAGGGNLSALSHNPRDTAAKEAVFGVRARRETKECSCQRKEAHAKQMMPPAVLFNRPKMLLQRSHVL